MPVKVSEIRKKLVFTAELRRLSVERLDLLPEPDLAPVQVRMRHVKQVLHPELGPTDLWTYDGEYPGKAFVVRCDQTVRVEWINEIAGALPFSVISSGYVPLRAASKCPENEPGAVDGGKDPSHPVATPCKVEIKRRALPAWTTVHLHGARVAPDSDGWTENAFLPRTVQTASQNSVYPPQPRSMMLWYHDHAYTITRLNVFSGLAGAWIVRDPDEERLNLPAGEFELPLIIQDRNFETDGEFLTARLMHKVETDSDKAYPGSSDTAEFFGPFTLVNGSLWPRVEVQAEPYRLRVLNGSNARTYQLFLVDDTNQIRNDLIRQIGTDAGLLAAPVSIDTLKYPPDPSLPDLKGLILSPAERADLIIDFQRAPGRTLRWVNVAAAPFDGVYAAPDQDATGKTAAPEKKRPSGKKDPSNFVDPKQPPDKIRAMDARLPFPEVMQFVVGKGAARRALALDTLSSFKRWTHDSPELKGHKHRWLGLNEKTKGADLKPGFLFFNELVELMEGHNCKEDFKLLLDGEKTPRRFVNRRVFFRSPINFYPEADGPEVWHIINFSADTHPIHVHLVDFQILSRRMYKVEGTGSDAKIADSVDGNGLLVRSGQPGAEVLVVPDPDHTNDPARPDGVDANEAGWKDTVRVNPNELVTIAMVFKGFTGRFMYHCHILEHEDMDMMRPFVVVPSAVKPFINDMLMMAGDTPDMGGM